MRILPVGIESRLLLAQWALWHTARILRYGVAQSLLAVRLRYQNGYLFYPVSFAPAAKPAVALPAITLTEVEAIRPLDLLWPSEITEDELVVVIEEEDRSLPPEPGSILDILT